jgi:hypothetical protein
VSGTTVTGQSNGVIMAAKLRDLRALGYRISSGGVEVRATS